MRLDLFLGWLQRCVADFTKDHSGEEHEPLEWLGLLFTDVSDLPNPVEQAERKPVLMVTASTRPGTVAPEGANEEGYAEEPGYCLGLRFCTVGDVARVERLLVEQVRRRYSVYTGMKPREVRRALVFTVYEVPDPPKRGGWPKWLGPTGYYV